MWTPTRIRVEFKAGMPEAPVSILTSNEILTGLFCFLQPVHVTRFFVQIQITTDDTFIAPVQPCAGKLEAVLPPVHHRAGITLRAAHSIKPVIEQLDLPGDLIECDLRHAPSSGL